MYIRIPLTDKNSTRTPVNLQEIALIRTLENYPQQLRANSRLARIFSRRDTLPALRVEESDLPRISYSLAPASAGDYASSYYPHPVVPLAMQVPEGDVEAVGVWLGDTANRQLAVSDTFQRRMTTAVLGAAEEYMRAMTDAGLFTRPFRAGCALRLHTGRHLALGDPQLIVPNASAPLMLIHEPMLNGRTFSTLTEIVNTPVLLRARVEPFILPADLAAQVTHLDFYITRETEVFGGDEIVSGIRTYSYAGENCPGWYYRPLDEDRIREAAMADEAFRIVASVPVEEAIYGIDRLTLPADPSALQSWGDLPEYSDEPDDDPGGVIDPDNPPVGYDWVILQTVPLRLSWPGRHRHLRGLQVGGVYQRRQMNSTAGANELRVWLLGSHHRDEWHRLGVSRGGAMALYRAIHYDWLRVVIQAPRTAILDTLLFHI